VSKNVLIADDSASMRRSVRFLLERRHSKLLVSEAVDGVDALEKAKETKPDLILLDLAIPRLNGADAATVLKGLCSNGAARRSQPFSPTCVPSPTSTGWNGS
jgi:CheY-like chemotaxis protein